MCSIVLALSRPWILLMSASEIPEKKDNVESLYLMD